jgi:hypothetical protein
LNLAKREMVYTGGILDFHGTDEATLHPVPDSDHTLLCSCDDLHWIRGMPQYSSDGLLMRMDGGQAFEGRKSRGVYVYGGAGS